jgi:hypothetical protein
VRRWRLECRATNFAITLSRVDPHGVAHLSFMRKLLGYAFLYIFIVLSGASIGVSAVKRLRTWGCPFVPVDYCLVAFSIAAQFGSAPVTFHFVSRLHPTAAWLRSGTLHSGTECALSLI